MLPTLLFRARRRYAQEACLHALDAPLFRSFRLLLYAKRQAFAPGGFYMLPRCDYRRLPPSHAAALFQLLPKSRQRPFSGLCRLFRWLRLRAPYAPQRGALFYAAC